MPETPLLSPPLPSPLTPLREGRGEIGDRRPPLATRFRPGRSGNPRGRPKTASRLRALVTKELNEEVEATENGQPVRITKLEATVKQFVNLAARGDRHAAQLVFSLVADDRDPPAPPRPPQRTREGDAIVVAEIVRRLSRRPQ
jgi:hypothetical protein